MQEAADKVLLIADEPLGNYGFPGGHPFGQDRLAAFNSECARRGLADGCLRRVSRVAEPDELLGFHTPGHVARVRAGSLAGSGFLDGGDTPAWRGVFEAASRVVGATLEATTALLAGEARRAFVPIAGLHHAGRDHAAGFCVFNDIGVAIELLRRYGLERVAYVDIDAHHGDGVFYAYESDPQLCFADIHEDGQTLYPGTGTAAETGKGAAEGTKLNLPLPAGAGPDEFDAAWQKVLAHVAAAEPQFIILQCGADSVAGDPLTHLQLTAACHGRAAADLARLADDLGHGRLLALGGGGYNRDNLARAWNDVLQALQQT
jgi:acetoin utilization protein AcuC